MSLNETYNKVHIGKHFCETFPIQNGLMQGDALLPLLFNFLIDASKEVGLKVNAEKTKYMLMHCHQNARKYHNMKMGNRSLKMWQGSDIWEWL
jgi:hypothetical protein